MLLKVALFLTVTDTPTGFMAERTGYQTVQLSWTAIPASSTPPVAGYEVFYAMSGNDSTQSGGITTSTIFSVTLPTLGVMYDFFVVAYSDDAANALPSARSRVITIDLSEFNL